MLSLGVLFLLSASFLAIQIWSDGGEMRGAAAALESPILPPDLTAPIVVPPPRPVSQAKAKKDAVPVVEEVLTEDQMPIEDNGGDKVEVPVSEEKSNQTHEKFKAEPVKLEKPQLAKSAPEPKADTKEVRDMGMVLEAKAAEPEKKPVKIEKSEKSAEKKVQNLAAKPVKVLEIKPERVDPVGTAEVKVVAPPIMAAKPVKKSRKPRSQEIETEVPPEWNWFSTPLKFDVNDGKLEIVADPGKKMVNQPLTVSRPVQITEEIAEVSEEKPVLNHQIRFEKPFAKALAKMNKLKERRQGVKKPVINKVPAVVARSEAALKRIQGMVRNICSDEVLENATAEEKAVDSSAEVAETSVEASENQSVTAISSLSVNESQSEESSYTGSGSSFSMRVNELIRSGAWLQD